MTRWHEQLRHQGYPAIFFDAWKNDFTADPLLAFIAELDDGLSDFFSRIPVGDTIKKAAVKKLKNLSKAALKVGAIAVAKHALGVSVSQLENIWDEQNDDVADDSEAMNSESDTSTSSESKVEKIDYSAVKKELEKAFSEALKEHKTIKSAIVQFKQKLTILIEALEKSAGIQLPMFVFVDELDRCRPNYAIELLEGIKHLFGVPGVYFVITTNLQQLSESVRAIYGAGFDSANYLNRFFDLQYSLPEPTDEQFSRQLFEKLDVVPDVKNLIFGLNRCHVLDYDHAKHQTSPQILSFVFKLFVDAFELGLRDQLQIVNIIEAAFISLNGQRIHVFFLFFLAIIYHRDPIVYRNIAKARNLSSVTGFDKLHKRNGKGRFSIQTSTDFPPKIHVNEHNAIGVATTYFSVLEIHPEKWAQLERDTDNFPGMLFEGVQGTRKGRNLVPHFVNYFSIVQHAGGFARNS